MKRAKQKRSAPAPRPAPAQGGGVTTIVLSLAGLVMLASMAWWLWPSRTETADGPIVFISIDTLRADRLPAYGYAGTSTPHIDRLVQDGVLFERAYSQSPQTLPSHTSIFSGLLPFEHGVRDNIGFTVSDDYGLLQEALGAHGFETGGFVSAYVLRKQTGFSRGFTHYDDELPAASPDLPLGQVQRRGEDTVAAAIRWLDARPSSRLFLFVHIYEPHRPYTPPERFAGKAPYDGEVEYSDFIIGRLLEHLRAKDLYDPATIVLFADHGEGLGDHGEDEHGMFLYRETIQIPLVVKLPHARGAGRRVNDPVQQIDLLPTILDLAGLEAPDGLRGRSLRAVLEDTGTLPEAGMYAETLSPRYHFGWSELYALGDSRYRLIRAPRDELFDIVQDPGETTSIAGERPQVRDAMRRALDSMIAGAGVDAPAAVPDEDRQKLAALGYVGTQTGESLRIPGDELPDPKDKIDVLKQYKRATELAGARRFDEAAGALRDLLQTDPQMTDVWVQLAGMYERLGRIEDAVEAYRGGIRSNPQNPSSLTGAAAGFLQLRRLDEARAHAELAVSVAPAAAHELLMRIAIEQGNAEAARRHARLAHEADPTLPSREMTEGLLLHGQGKYEEAVPRFAKAREVMAGRTVKVPDVNYYLADSLARLERYQEAEAAFAAELAVFPNNARAHAGRAMLYRATGRDAESERAIAELLRLGTPEARDLAAQLWTIFGEPEKAAALRRGSR